LRTSKGKEVKANAINLLPGFLGNDMRKIDGISVLFYGLTILRLSSPLLLWVQESGAARDHILRVSAAHQSKNEMIFRVIEPVN